MIPKLRQDYILGKLSTKRIVYISELSLDLNVSESTIRRDLKELEYRNRAIILRGGGVKAFEDIEKSYVQKRSIDADKKDIIGRKAAKLIENGDFIYIDSGTTPLAMIKYLHCTNITVVTSNTMLISLLPQKGIKCILLGGYVNLNLSSITGTFADSMLEEMFFDKVFLGASAYFENEGYYTYDITESRKKTISLKNSKEAYVLADTSKKNKRGFSRFAEFDEAKLISED